MSASVEMKLVVPSCKYLGPNGEAEQVPALEQVLLVDKVAFLHDLAYQQATSRWHIIKADLVAVGLFIWVGLLAVLSAICLCTKVLVEVLLGPIYPRRFCNGKAMLAQVLVVSCLLWLCLLEFRLEGMQGKSGHRCARQPDTWTVVLCLLEEAQKKL